LRTSWQNGILHRGPFCGFTALPYVPRPIMNDDQLSLLSKTIAAHAREVAGKEWKDEHRPVLISILTHAGLGNLDEGMLTLQDKEVPIKVIVTALHEQFLQARTKALMEALANKVVESAMRAIPDEP
jgi:hypothetical protein